LHFSYHSAGRNHERAFNALIELEDQIIRLCGLALARQADHLRFPAIFEVDDELEMPAEFANPLLRLHDQQPVAILSRQGVRLDAKAIDADTARLAPGCHQRLEKRQIFLKQRIFFGKRANLTRQVSMSRQFDLQLPFCRRDLAPQDCILILQARIEVLEPALFALRLALIEARILPAEIVGQPRNAQRQPRDDDDRQPAPIPWDMGVNRHPGRGNAEAALDGS